MPFTWRKPANFAILLVGFALAFDFSVVAISIQSYWEIVAPTKSSLFGFVFGCYDLTQFLFMPVFGYLSDYIGIRMCILIALLLNMCGNIVYSFGLYAGTSTDDSSYSYALGTYQMLIVGRLVAGIGSSALGLGLVYLARTTTVAERMEAVGVYRASQALARAVGPFITFALEGMSFQLVTDEQLVFNFYTIPGWIAVLVALIVFTVFFIAFENPILPKPTGNTKFHFAEAKNLVFHSSVICSLHFVVTFAVMSAYSELFGMAAAEYQIINSAGDIWMCYVALGAAAGFAFHIWRKIINVFQDYTFVLGSLNLASIAFLFFIDYGKNGNPPPAALFYTASVFLGFTIILYFANMESFYTKKMTQYGGESANHEGFFIALQPAAGALGRFLGPVILAAGIPVSQSNPRDCDPSFSFSAAYMADSNTLTSMFGKCDLSQFCLLMFPQQFFTSGCSFDVTPWMIVMAVVVLAVFIYLSFFYLPAHAFHGSGQAKLEEADISLNTNLQDRLLSQTDDEASYASP